MTTREKLLRELDEVRWIIMHQLADDAHERGDSVMERGWRWLAQNKKWPHPRSDRRYGWSARDMLDEETVRYEGALPGYFDASDLDMDAPCYRATRKKVSEILVLTAEAVGRWLEDQDVQDDLEAEESLTEEGLL